MSSGISPICIRYIRTGSSMQTLDPPATSSISFRASGSSAAASSCSTFGLVVFEGVELGVDGRRHSTRSRFRRSNSRSTRPADGFLVFRARRLGRGGSLARRRRALASSVLASGGFAGVLGQRLTPRCQTGLQAAGVGFGRQEKQFECQGPGRIRAHRRQTLM